MQKQTEDMIPKDKAQALASYHSREMSAKERADLIAYLQNRPLPKSPFERAQFGTRNLMK